MLRRSLAPSKLVSACLLAACLQGCVTVPPVQNQTDLSSVDFSQLAKFKQGESCTTFLFGFIPFGSTRIVSAVKDAQIKQLKIIEYEYRYYYLVNQFCLIAYGL
jgi:hypothetical protein